ncbi:O protein [Yersinia pseudotuberculosis]|uniref:O protein n=1 Tax=Yersinia pseudotuberculosis TaxID=633 RepID=A0A380Q848_YERPU|nr:O protein [Yersinia pseudotuberculosis]
MNNLHELDQTLSTLLAQLAPQARGAFMRQVAKELRRRQQKHIQAQQNPDGSPFVPRKKKRRDKLESIITVCGIKSQRTGQQ